MAVTLCELKWLWCLLHDLRSLVTRPILLHYDNQVAKVGGSIENITYLGILRF